MLLGSVVGAGIVLIVQLVLFLGSIYRMMVIFE